MKKPTNNIKFILIIAIYFLMITGGLWHQLGLFQPAMDILAGPLLISISLIIFSDFVIHAGKKRSKMIFWGVLVFVVGFIAEIIGVKTGLIFGHYSYGKVLQPQVYGVPVAIGCAWVGILFSSLAVAQRITRHFIWLPIFNAFLMVVFDIFLEPTAVLLNYWTWQNSILLQNYIAWFVIGLFLALYGQRQGLLKIKSSSMPAHAYLAQILYFVIVISS